MGRYNIDIPVLRRSIYGSITDDGKYEKDTIKDVIAWLESILENIPAEYRDAAKIDIDSVGGYEGEHHSEVEISYTRPETDEEMNNRIAIARARAEEDIRRHEHYAALARANLQNLP